MKLGILVNTDKNLPDVIGITNSAIAKGHSVIIFAMDLGTHLLANADFSSLSAIDGVTMSFCAHSAEDMGAKTDGLPEAIAHGSQFHNASMNNESDKVIVL